MPKPAPIRYPGTARFKVGDRVTFQMASFTIPAVVIEDRGPLGRRGRRLCRVRYELSETGVEETTMPEDELTPA